MAIESTLAQIPTTTSSLRDADVNAAEVRTLLSSLEERGMVLDSLHVVRNGMLALDYWRWPHTPDRLHTLHSSTKSFTGAAVGFAVDEGLLKLDDAVAPFFADRYATPPGPYAEQMRIRDLLTMTAGNTAEISGSTTRLRTDGWINDFLEQPLPMRPGTHFKYSSMSSHALSAIVGLVAGVSVSEYLRPRLFEPLGIDDYHWQHDPEGVSSGGNGLSLRPLDLMKFGVLHLQDGLWDGRRILPELWVRQASFPQVPGAHRRGGYGYQFWTFPSGAYNAEGRFGQNTIVFPAHDAVVSATSSMSEPAWKQMPDMLLDTFTTAFEQGGGDNDPADEDWVTERAHRQRHPIELIHDGGPATMSQRYRFEPNNRGLESILIEADESTVTVTIRDERGEHTIPHGRGSWRETRTGVSVWRLHHSYQEDDAAVLAGAEWAANDQLRLRWLFVESPKKTEKITRTKNVWRSTRCL